MRVLRKIPWRGHIRYLAAISSSWRKTPEEESYQLLVKLRSNVMYLLGKHDPETDTVIIGMFNGEYLFTDFLLTITEATGNAGKRGIGTGSKPSCLGRGQFFEVNHNNEHMLVVNLIEVESPSVYKFTSDEWNDLIACQKSLQELFSWLTKNIAVDLDKIIDQAG